MSRIFEYAAVLLLLTLTIAYPSACSDAVQSGLKLCLTRAIPSLFPFFVLSCIIVRCGLSDCLARLLAPLMRLYRLPSSGITALLLGFLGGYPSGAQTVTELVSSGRCTEQEGNRLLFFCNNTGPAFLIGLCGSSLFHSVRVGMYLYGIHILSACLSGFLFRGNAVSAQKIPVSKPPAFTRCLTESILQAGKTALCVTSFVLYFSVIISLLSQIGLISSVSRILSTLLPVSPDVCSAVLTGSLELTSGLAALSHCNTSPLTRLVICSGLCAFGGLCILFQSCAAAPHTTFSHIATGKFTHCILSIALTVLFSPFSGI